MLLHANWTSAMIRDRWISRKHANWISCDMRDWRISRKHANWTSAMIRDGQISGKHANWTSVMIDTWSAYGKEARKLNKCDIAWSADICELRMFGPDHKWTSATSSPIHFAWRSIYARSPDSIRVKCLFMAGSLTQGSSGSVCVERLWTGSQPQAAPIQLARSYPSDTTCGIQMSSYKPVNPRKLNWLCIR